MLVCVLVPQPLNCLHTVAGDSTRVVIAADAIVSRAVLRQTRCNVQACMCLLWVGLGVLSLLRTCFAVEVLSLYPDSEVSKAQAWCACFSCADCVGCCVHRRARSTVLVVR